MQRLFPEKDALCTLNSYMATPKKVLCIEDDTFLVNLIMGKLADADIQAIGAHNGVVGLSMAAVEHPALIMLDLMLPDIRGNEVLVQLKKNPETKDIPVIIFSNLGDREEIEKAMGQGASAYLIKSSTLPGEVVEIVKKQLEISHSSSA